MTQTKFSPRGVRSERKRLGLTLKLYARLVGVSWITIHSWERGQKRPSPTSLKKWNAVIGIAKEVAQRRVGHDPSFSPGAVRADRERLDLRVTDYARLLGVSRPTVYSWERGASTPRGNQRVKWKAVSRMSQRQAREVLGLSLIPFSPEALRVERARLQFSRTDYGVLVGVHEHTIYQWETGRRRPNRKSTEKLLAVKGIDMRHALEHAEETRQPGFQLKTPRQGTSRLRDCRHVVTASPQRSLTR